MFARLTHIEVDPSELIALLRAAPAPNGDGEDDKAAPKNGEQPSAEELVELAAISLPVRRVVCAGVGAHSGQTYSGECLVRPGGMVVVVPMDERVITTADESIAAAREREDKELAELRASGMSARTGGQGIPPEAARIPARRPRRGSAPAS